jgi:hypothetical protein
MLWGYEGAVMLCDVSSWEAGLYYDGIDGRLYYGNTKTGNSF